MCFSKLSCNHGKKQKGSSHVTCSSSQSQIDPERKQRETPTMNSQEYPWDVLDLPER